jgi:hypothetical protein
VVLPLSHRLQRSAVLLPSAAQLALKLPLGHLARSVEFAAGARQPGGTTAQDDAAGRHEKHVSRSAAFGETYCSCASAVVSHLANFFAVVSHD